MRHLPGRMKEDRMSKFKFRYAKLIITAAALVALVVDGGAGFKF